MIYSLATLNDAVNNVVNHITEKVCRETTDGAFQIDLDDIDMSGMTPYMSWEDLHEYKDFIFTELADRPEFEDIDYTDQGFSGICKREYCPNLADRVSDEPLHTVQNTLSMTDLANIGEKVMEKLAHGHINNLQQSGLTTKEQTFEEDQENLYLLCERQDDFGDQIDFKILAVSRDEEALKDLLAAKVAFHEYSRITASSDPPFRNVWDDTGDVQYFILEEPVLNREQVQSMLKTLDLNEFHWPDNMFECLVETVDCFLIQQGYRILDSDKAAEALLNDKDFQKTATKYGLHAMNHLYDSGDSYNRIMSATDEYLKILTYKDPKWLEQIGAVNPFIYPSNLKDVLVDAIHNISKELNLNVRKADVTAIAILNSPDFRIKVLPDLVKYGTAPVDLGSKEYEEIISKCCNNVAQGIVPQDMIIDVPVPANILISQAQARARELTQSNIRQPEKGR